MKRKMKGLLEIGVMVLIVLVFISGRIFSEGVSAEEIKADTLAAVEGGDITSYRFSIDMTMTTVIEYEEWASSMDMAITGEGAVDLTNKLISMDVSSTSSGILVMEVEFEYYIVDDEMYMKMDFQGSEQWIKMELSEYAISWDSYDQMGEQAELLETAGVERLDDEVVNGVDCYVLNIIPDLGEYYEMMMNQQDLGSGSITDSEIIDISDLITGFSIKMWIDKDTDFMMKLDVQMAMDISYEGTSSSTDMEMIMLFTDYNVPVEIVLSEEAENAIDYSDYLTSDLTPTEEAL